MKAIFSYIRNNDTRKIVDCLSTEYNWEPVAFHGSNDMEKWVSESYPNAHLFDSLSLRKGVFNYTEKGFLEPIDQKIINTLSPYLINYMSWLQDSSGWDFSFNERRNYLIDILNFWNSVILKLKPEVFFSYTWPHLPSDYPLYLLCKHVYKIKTIFIDITPHFNQDRYAVSNSLEDLSFPYRETYISGPSTILPEEIKNYLNTLSSPNAKRPNHIDRHYEILNKQNINKKVFFSFIRSLLGMSTPLDTYKVNRRPLGSNNCFPKPLKQFFLHLKKASTLNKIMKFYRGICIKSIPSKKFIYFAAPFQPEAISNINQGIYENIPCILDNLLRYLPDDYIILYKEHPNTFLDTYKGCEQRSIGFYKAISDKKKVFFVNDSISSFDLIVKCEASATVGGTVGWESLAKGKHCLAFGTIWYDACNGIFKIRCTEDVKKAILKILSGSRPSIKEYNKYAQSIYENTFHFPVTATGYEEKIKLVKDVDRCMCEIAHNTIKAMNKYYDN